MAAAPSAGPLTSLSEKLWWKNPSGWRCSRENFHVTRTAALPLYFFYFLQGKGDEENKKNRAAA